MQTDGTWAPHAHGSRQGTRWGRRQTPTLPEEQDGGGGGVPAASEIRGTVYRDVVKVPTSRTSLSRRPSTVGAWTGVSTLEKASALPTKAAPAAPFWVYVNT